MSSLNENINFEMESLAKRANYSLLAEDARDLLLHLEFMPCMYAPCYLGNSAITCLHSYEQAFLLSVNVGLLNISDKCHSTVYSLRGICFLDQKNTQAAMPTTICVLQITRSLSKKKTPTVQITPPLLGTDISLQVTTIKQLIWP